MKKSRRYAEGSRQRDEGGSLRSLPTAYGLLPTSFRTRRRGFTLVEVMISIAIALVLILGVSEIFSIAQRTTGGGTTVLAATETDVSAQSVFKDDFRTMADGTTDSPGLVIVSYSMPAWRNQADKQQDQDGKILTINDSSLAIDATSVNSRVHRLDRICFFARDRFTRQTADAPSLVSSTTSNEAFIWIGHLAIPNNNALKELENGTSFDQIAPYKDPGDTSTDNTSNPNDNNRYASDWILGREVMLLSPSAGTMGTNYFGGTDPLSMIPVTTSKPGGYSILDSRCDLAQTSIALYRQYLAGLGSPQMNYANPSLSTWWQSLIGMQVASDGTISTPATATYRANPFVVKPTTPNPNWMSDAAAQSYPIFVRGCSQFIVEYAGDYVQQNSNGTIAGAGQDGQIDYIVDPTTGTHQIRWYGFPRDTNDDGKIDGQHDVLPVTTVLSSAGVTAPPMPFEKAVPTPPYPASEASPGLASASQAYVCAWGPDTDGASIPRPKMIRITMAVDDPAGHLNAEQTYVYVFNLP